MLDASQSPARLPAPRSRAARGAPAGRTASASGDAVEDGRRLISLPRDSGVRLRQDCFALIGDRIRQPPNGEGPWLLETSDGPLRIEFDLGRHEVLVEGPVPVIEQFARLLEALSRRYQTGGMRTSNDAAQGTRVMLLPREIQADVQQLFRSWTDDVADDPRGIRRTLVDNPVFENVLLRGTGARQATGGKPSGQAPGAEQQDPETTQNPESTQNS